MMNTWKDLSAARDEHYFYLHCQFHQNFRKNDAPHNLKDTLCILSGEVKHASYSYVAVKVGSCNHVLTLLMKIYKFTLYECENINELDTEENMQPKQKQACTSTLQQWHQKGRGDSINPQPVMKMLVTKTYLDQSRSSTQDPGVSCSLYEARNNIRKQRSEEEKLLATLKELNPNMALALIMTPRSESNTFLETKFGKLVLRAHMRAINLL